MSSIASRRGSPTSTGTASSDGMPSQVIARSRWYTPSGAFGATAISSASGRAVLDGCDPCTGIAENTCAPTPNPASAESTVTYGFDEEMCRLPETAATPAFVIPIVRSQVSPGSMNASPSPATSRQSTAPRSAQPPAHFATWKSPGRTAWYKGWICEGGGQNPSDDEPISGLKAKTPTCPYCQSMLTPFAT